MWPDRVVVDTPLFDQHLGFVECVEDLSVEQLVSQFAVEALVVAVLTQTTVFDEQNANIESLQLLAHGRGGELRPMV